MRYLLFVAAIFGLSSCSQASKSQNAVINGNMESMFNNWLYLVQPDAWSNKPNIIDSAQITNEGDFSFTVQAPEFEEYFISGKGFFITSVFVENGTNLKLQIKGSNSERNVTFEGEGAAENQFWQKMNKRFYQNGGFNEHYRALVSADEPLDFKNNWNEYAQSQMAVLDSFNKAAKPSKDFYKWAKSYVNLSTATKYYTYLFHRPQLAKLPDPYIKANSTYYAFKDDVNLDKIGYQKHNAYNDYIYVTLLDYRMSYGKDEAFKETYEYAKSEFKGEAAELAAAGVLKDLIEGSDNKKDFELVKELLADFKTWSKNDKYLEFLNAKFSSKAALAPGSPAPDFTFENAVGEKVSLSDFTGKVVVIDFWGTWCGPCKRELPYSKQIESHFADNEDVVFLFVALERGDKATWLNYINDNELPGVHLFAQGQTPSLIPYKISSVPRYVLIGRDGTIFNAYASRPSQNMQSQIQNALDEKL